MSGLRFKQVLNELLHQQQQQQQQQTAASSSSSTTTSFPGTQQAKDRLLTVAVHRFGTNDCVVARREPGPHGQAVPRSLSRDAAPVAREGALDGRRGRFAGRPARALRVGADRREHRGPVDHSAQKPVELARAARVAEAPGDAGASARDRAPAVAAGRAGGAVGRSGRRAMRGGRLPGPR